MTRTLLTAPTGFFCNPTTGNLSNDGLSVATPLPQPQDVINRLQQSYDLGGYAADIYGADGKIFEGITLTGLLVGQRGPNLTFHCGSTPGASQIQPASNGAGAPGRNGIELNWGAMLCLHNATIDSSHQITAGGSLGNDCIALGQGARLAIIGFLQMFQFTAAYNHITAGSYSSIDISSGASVHFAGICQDGIQLDTSSLAADCNDVHGKIAMYADTSSLTAVPLFSHAFVDLMGASKATLSGVDFHTGGQGYRYHIREGSTLHLNLANDPGQAAAMLGTVDTTWPVEGHLT